MDDRRDRFAREWLEKALHDRRAAEALAQNDPALNDIVAFHCQQAVEKVLKGFLTYHGRALEKTHSIGHLCNLCAMVDPSFQKLADRADPLTDFAVDFRYPGITPPGREEVDRALHLLAEIWLFVTDRLSDTLKSEYGSV